MITFTAGLDASFLMPGETVLIQNKYRAGKRNSGRIVSFTKNSITLDAPVSLKKSGSFIRIINQEGKIVERDINETGDNITKVTFKTALATADQPVANGVWTITEPDPVPMRARVVAIAQGETRGRLISRWCRTMHLSTGRLITGPRSFQKIRRFLIPHIPNRAIWSSQKAPICPVRQLVREADACTGR